MPDISITTTEVGPTDDTITQVVQLGETVTAGEAVYYKSSDEKYWLADNSTGADEAAVRGIAMNDGDADEYISIAIYGKIRTGNTSMTVSEVYVLTTSGGIGPASDLGSGDYCTPVYISDSASTAILCFKSQTAGAFTTGVARP